MDGPQTRYRELSYPTRSLSAGQHGALYFLALRLLIDKQARCQ